MKTKVHPGWKQLYQNVRRDVKSEAAQLGRNKPRSTADLLDKVTRHRLSHGRVGVQHKGLYGQVYKDFRRQVKAKHPTLRGVNVRHAVKFAFEHHGKL